MSNGNKKYILYLKGFHIKERYDKGKESKIKILKDKLMKNYYKNKSRKNNN